MRSAGLISAARSLSMAILGRGTDERQGLVFAQRMLQRMDMKVTVQTLSGCRSIDSARP